jgi:hypothetical protein
MTRRPWTDADTRVLRRMAAHGKTLREIATRLERDRRHVAERAKRAGIEVRRKLVKTRWTAAMDAEVRRLYPTTAVVDIARLLRVTPPAAYQRAYKLGLKKPAEWAAECTRRRWAAGRHENSRAAQFRKGSAPWNKGVPGSTGHHPNSRRTQFQPGVMSGAAQYNYRPIGSLRISKDGYLERKVTDDHPTPARRWVGVHRLVWEAAHGPIPRGHIVVFKAGARTTDEALITPDRLELISRQEGMRRNTRHNRYSPEVNQIIQLAGALKRKINNRTRKLEAKESRT